MAAVAAEPAGVGIRMYELGVVSGDWTEYHDVPGLAVLVLVAERLGEVG